VFLALNKVELALLVLLLVLVRATSRAKDLWAYCGVLALIMIAQSAWLLPELAARSESIVAGVEPGPSIAHGAYAVSALAKLLLLLMLGFRTLSGQRAAA